MKQQTIAALRKKPSSGALWGFVFAALLLVPMLVPSAAHAGFKFVAPNGSGAAPAMPAALPTNAVVEGFADRVPLAVALRQILPRGTIYNIAPDVDMGVQVSWQGGRPWQDVLRDSLAAVGLQANVRGTNVQVTRAAFLNGNVTGTSEPIQLQPPVRLTPPIAPVTIGGDDDVAARSAPAPAANMLPEALPAAPLATPPAVKEITSLDPDIRAEVRDGTAKPLVMGSPPGYLTLPAGAENAAMLSADGAASTLAPLDGAAVGTADAVEVNPPLIMGEAQMADPNLWEAKAGQTLREVVTAWAERAGVEVNWQSEYDYPVQASLNYNGTFEEAIRTLLYGFKDAAPQPIGRLHRNQNVGQQALLITTRGNIYEE